MKKFKKLSIFLFVLGSILIFNSCDWIEDVPENEENTTDFEVGADGWKIEGDAVQSEPLHSTVNGLNNSGYIFAKDFSTGGVWYFVAPSRYHTGVLSYNGYLDFYLIQESAMSNQFNDRDIIIEGGSEGTLTYYFDSFPGKTWTHYKVNLKVDKNWYDEDGFLASETKMRSVLGNIKKISIRGEYESGPDTGGLDNFTVK